MIGRVSNPSQQAATVDITVDIMNNQNDNERNAQQAVQESGRCNSTGCNSSGAGNNSAANNSR